MTIRETTPLQKKIHHFSLIKHLYRCLSMVIVLLFVFSNNLSAQNVSDGFESEKPTTQELANNTDEKNDVKKEITTSSQEQVIAPMLEKPVEKKEIAVVEQSPEQTLEQIPEQTPPVENQKLAELEQKITKQQDLIEQLSLRVDALNTQNQEVNTKLAGLQTSLGKQSQQPAQLQKTNNHPKIKAQLIQLAIQTSQLKPEVGPVEKTKQEPKKEGAWYEKLVVVKKIEKTLETKQSMTPLYAILKQFDLLELALETNNQEQWQSTISSLTTTLSNQYPVHAQDIVQQLKALQTQTITDSTQTDNAPVDEKFGIK